jgi:hypothetical protein
MNGPKSQLRSQRPSTSQPERDAASAVARTPRLSAMNIVADVVRHAMPLLPLYIFSGNFASYLLLTAFDLSLGLMLIVGTTRDRSDPTSVDPRSRWLVMRLIAVLAIAVFFAIVAAIVAMPIAAPAFIFGLSTGVDWWATVSDKRFWIPVVGMSLLAAARAQGAFDATTTPGRPGPPSREAPVIGDLEQDRKRSLAANAAQVTLIATFVGLCYLLINFGRWGLYALPVLYTALLVFYDARPNLAQQIFPKLWREK